MTWRKHEPNKDYQDWELQEIVQKYTDDGELTQEQYDDRRQEDEPSAQTIVRRFGSWSDAVHAGDDDVADEETSQTDEPEESTSVVVEEKAVEEYTREDCIRAADEVSQRVNGQLTFHEYIEFRDGSHPPKEAIGRHFTDWNELLEQLGGQFERFELQEAVRIANKRTDDELTKEAYEKVRDEKFPTAKRIEEEFGDWQSVLQESIQ